MEFLEPLQPDEATDGWRMHSLRYDVHLSNIQKGKELTASRAVRRVHFH